jgi:hypothetical protein
MQVQSKRATDADWSESFADAPQAYRIAACKGLDALSFLKTLSAREM